MIKQELLASGFTEKQLPGWIGSKADTTNIKNTINTTNTKNTKNTIEQMKPAGNKPPERKIPPNKQSDVFNVFVVFVCCV
jgi:hypothetical protein